MFASVRPALFLATGHADSIGAASRSVCIGATLARDASLSRENARTITPLAMGLFQRQSSDRERVGPSPSLVSACRTLHNRN